MPGFLHSQESLRKHSLNLSCEALEQRTVLNGSGVTASMGSEVLDHGPRRAYALESRPHDQPAIGTIAGTITNAANGQDINHVRVELIDSQGHVALTTRTNALGQYQLEIRANGPYVVREVPPTGFVQRSPTFIYTKPNTSGATCPFSRPSTSVRRPSTSAST